MARRSSAAERRADEGDRVSIRDMAVYAAPISASYLLLGPTWNIVPVIYSKYFGLELTAVALVVLLARLFDAVTDPLIGFLSDRHRMSGGQRRLWVISGGLLTAVSAYLLFYPPLQPTFSYYLALSFVFYLSFTIMEIPHTTWGAEIAQSYKKRSRIFSFRSAAIYVGYILYVAVPLLPIYESPEFTPAILRDVALVGAGLMILMLIPLLRVRPGRPWTGEQRRAGGFREAIFSNAALIFRNRPLRIVIAAFFFFNLSLGMYIGLYLIFLDSYLGIGEKYAIIMIWANSSAFVSTYLWAQSLKVFSKTFIWTFGSITYVTAIAAHAIIEPGAQWWNVMAFMILVQISLASFYVVVPAILGDVADYGELKFKRVCGGVYFALYALTAKFSMAAGISLGLAIAGNFGVDPSAAALSESGIRGLRLGLTILPACIGLITIGFIFMMPIDERRHKVIRARLERRSSRQLHCETA